MAYKNLISKYIKPLVPHPTGLSQKGRIREDIECVLFDIYGSLFISGTGDISSAKNQTKTNPDLEILLKTYDIRSTPKVLIKNLFDVIEGKHRESKREGIDFPEVEIDRIWSEVLNNDDMESVRNFAVEYEWIVNPVYPMPHLGDLLLACRNKEITMGIISNAQFHTPDLFQWFFDAGPVDLGFHLDLMFYSYQCGYAKPSLHMFQAAASILRGMGVSAGSVLYTGNDMLNDIYPAQKVGFRTGLFAGDKRSLRLREDDPRCKDLEADIVVTDLIQLLDYL